MIHDYSSSQLDLSEKDSRMILDFNRRFIKESDLAEDGRETDVHITVLYSLLTDFAFDLISVVKGYPAFMVTLGKTSLFTTDPNYDVVKIDVTSLPLRKLNKLLIANIPNENKFKYYLPHITLAYLKKQDNRKYIGNSHFLGKRILFNALTFSGRNGQKEIIQF